MSPDKRKKLGSDGRAHVLKNYNFEKLQQKWIEVIDKIVEEEGSWETRKITMESDLRRLRNEKDIC